MSESLIFLSESLIRSFLDKKRAIRSEIKWVNSQPWAKKYYITLIYRLYRYMFKVVYFTSINLSLQESDPVQYVIIAKLRSQFC